MENKNIARKLKGKKNIGLTKYFLYGILKIQGVKK
jgi:hypothetical protein